MNKYKKVKMNHQKQIDNFSIAFAYSNEQFKKGMKQLELDPEKDTDKVIGIGSGGFIRKEDAEDFVELIKEYHDRLEKEIEEDETGDGFIYDMFLYELANHEFIVTYRYEDTLDALGLTMEDVKEDETLQKGLRKAKTKYLKQYK